MQRCQFVKSVTERGSGRLCSARPVTVSSAAFHQAVLPLQPQTVQDVGNEAQTGASASMTVLEHTMLFSHVLDLRTPLLRQGEVTESFCFVHFLRKLWKVLFFLEGHMYWLLHGELLFISPIRRVGSEFRLCWLRLISTDAFLASDVNGRKF